MIHCMHRSRTVSEKNIKYKNIGTELKIGTDSDENLFINIKWP
jgi:hypothetical protein